jgi:hypothetical protein
MTKLRSYGYDFYTEEATRSRADLKAARDLLKELKALQVGQDAIDKLESTILYLKALLNNTVDRQFSAKRTLDVANEFVLGHGIELPETFPNGKTYKVCDKCRQRRDIADYIVVGKSYEHGYKFKSTCCECRFKPKSADFVEGVKARTKKQMEYRGEETERICVFCGQLLPIDRFGVDHVYLHGGCSRRRTCKKCTPYFQKHFSRKGIRTNQPQEMPFLFNPQDPSQSILNPKFFIEKYNILDDSVKEHMDELVEKAMGIKFVTKDTLGDALKAIGDIDESLAEKLKHILGGE